MSGKRWLYFAAIFHPFKLSLMRTRELFKVTTMKRATATKTSLKSEVTLLQALSGLFYIVHSVKRCQFISGVEF